MRSEKSKKIDALRGVAILGVVLFHYMHSTHLDRWLNLPFPAVKTFGYGWTGVDLFFVLSSFLLARNLLLRRDAPGAAMTFYRRRLLRIAPMYLTLLAAAFLFSLFWPPGWLVSNLAPIWVYALFLQNFWAGLNDAWGGQFLAPTWSLAVEEHFYLVLPFIMLRLSRRGVFWIAVAFIVAAPLLREYAFLNVGVKASYAWTICRVDSFGWGILIALWPQIERPTRLRVALGWLVGLIAAAAWANIRAGTDEKDVSAVLTVTTLLAAAAVFLVVSREVVSRQRVDGAGSGARTSFVFDALAFLGERCFSIYLLHIPVLGILSGAIGNDAPLVSDAASALVPVAAFGLTLRLAMLTYRFIERPFMDHAEANAPWRAQATAGLAPANFPPSIL